MSIARNGQGELIARPPTISQAEARSRQLVAELTNKIAAADMELGVLIAERELHLKKLAEIEALKQPYAYLVQTDRRH